MEVIRDFQDFMETYDILKVLGADGEPIVRAFEDANTTEVDSFWVDQPLPTPLGVYVGAAYDQSLPLQHFGTLEPIGSGAFNWWATDNDGLSIFIDFYLEAEPHIVTGIRVGGTTGAESHI